MWGLHKQKVKAGAHLITACALKTFCNLQNYRQKVNITRCLGTASDQYPCCCSVAKSCPTLCHLMAYSTPGSPVLHYLPEFAQIYVHWVIDAISWPLRSAHMEANPGKPGLKMVFKKGLKKKKKNPEWRHQWSHNAG